MLDPPGEPSGPPGDPPPLPDPEPGKNPLGTFAINIIGSLIIGIIFGFAERYQWMTQEWRLFLAIGFCGSFTTFSTFAFDNLQLIKDGNYYQLFWYTSLSFVVGVALAWLGFIMARS